MDSSYNLCHIYVKMKANIHRSIVLLNEKQPQKGGNLLTSGVTGDKRETPQLLPSNSLVRVNEDCMHSHHSFLNKTYVVHLTVG